MPNLQQLSRVPEKLCEHHGGGCVESQADARSREAKEGYAACRICLELVTKRLACCLLRFAVNADKGKALRAKEGLQMILQCMLPVKWLAKKNKCSQYQDIFMVRKHKNFL